MTNFNKRRLDWSRAQDDIAQVCKVLAVINPGREPSKDYIPFLADRAFYNEGLASYIGTGGWYVTVFDTGERDEDGTEVWRPHISLMVYSVARYLEVNK